VEGYCGNGCEWGLQDSAKQRVRLYYYCGGKGSCESISSTPSNVILCVCTACKSTIVRNNNIIIILRIIRTFFLKKKNYY